MNRKPEMPSVKTPSSSGVSLSLSLLAASIVLICGSILIIKLPYALTDYKGVYFTARCSLERCDPYNPKELVQRFSSDARFSVAGYSGVTDVIAHCVYLPTAFVLIFPFALLPFAASVLVWQIISAGALLLGCYLVLRSAGHYKTHLAEALVSLLVLNSVWLFMMGNSAMLAIGLCGIAAYAVTEERFQNAGIAALAFSLMLKPHIAGMIWLYCALAGPATRKIAWKSAALVVALSIPVVIWVGSESPHWAGELSANKAHFLQPGDLDDLGPSSPIGHTVDAIVDLQSVLSVVWDNPHFYDTTTYLICGSMLLVWIAATFRLPYMRGNAWLAIAAASALTMLPVYHRQHDARLIVLCIPACAALWSARGKVGWAAIIITSAAVILTGDIASALRIVLLQDWLEHQTGFLGRAATILLGRPAQLSLICLAVFYLWIYARRAFGSTVSKADHCASPQTA